ncbi:hypothetical protein IW261DRAFT_1652537, partial [Armillaria novae-zelandiae]
LRGIAHCRGVVYTYLKHDNIFFDNSSTCTRSPSRWTGSHGKFKTIAYALHCSDIPTAQLIDKHTENKISPPPLRPPEIIIGGLCIHIDIWMVGTSFSPLSIFELATGRALFNLNELLHISYQMLGYTCEDVRAKQLSVSAALVCKFFDRNCMCVLSVSFIFTKRHTESHVDTSEFKISIRSYKVIMEADMLSTVALMRRCLCLDPTQRASAAEPSGDLGAGVYSWSTWRPVDFGP